MRAKQFRPGEYNRVRGYAQAHGMSARMAGFDENGNRLWQLFSLETNCELSEPMTIEEFNERRAKGDTFYKRYFQPSLLRLVNIN